MVSSIFFQGVMIAFIGVVFLSLANTIMKKISSDNGKGGLDIYADLVFQYAFVAFIAFIVAALGSKQGFLPVFVNPLHYLLLVLLGIIGYAGIWSFLRGFEKANTGVVSIIASLNVFIGYFINITLFPNLEQLSIGKIMIAILFFLLISFFMRETGKSGKKVFQKHLMYPFLTAFSRAFFFNITNYFIKSEVMSSLQAVFMSEFSVFVAAVIVYVFVKKGNMKALTQQTLGNLSPYFFIGIFLVTGAMFMGYSYSLIPANVTNVIRLFGVMLTAVFTYFFLHDLLTKRQCILMIGAFILLVIFVFI